MMSTTSHSRKIYQLVQNKKSNAVEERDRKTSDAQNKSTVDFSRRNSLTKSSRIKLQNQSNDKIKDSSQKQQNQVIYGVAALEMKKEKLRLKKELKRQQEEQRNKEEQEKFLELERQKEQDEKNLRFQRLLVHFRENMQDQLEEANQQIKEIDDYNRNNSEEFLMDQMRGSDSSTKDEEEDQKLRELRKELLRRDSIEESLLSKMDTISPPKTEFSGLRLNIPQLSKHDSTSSYGNTQDLSKIAHEITDVHIEKEKYFKIVKEVISGTLLDKVIEITNEKENDETNKYSKKKIQNKLAQIKFIQKCKEENVLALPMLNRLKEKSLILNNYRMNNGISKALGASFKELNEYIEVLSLESNDLSDEALESILLGVKENKNIHTLSIKKNKIEDKSGSILRDLLEEKFEYVDNQSLRISSQIKSLKISNCTTRPGVIETIVSVLPDNRKLVTLQLNSVSFTNKSTKDISYFINENYNLRSLDLSWNEFKLSDLESLTNTIKNVSNIQYLNFAATPFSGPNAAQIADNIRCVMKSLVHLDLSGCNLNLELLMIIAKGMRSSRTLVAVHLSGNNMSDETKFAVLEEITRTTKRTYVNSNSIKNNEFLSQAKSKLSKENKKLKLSLQVQKRMEKYSLTYKSEGIKETIDDRIIYTRILGHIEIKESHVWQIDNKCWLCNKWHYTVIVVNKNIIPKLMNSSSQFDAEKYMQIIYTANKKENPGFSMYNSKPKISGNFSGWRSREMMPMLKFCELIQRNNMPPIRYYVEDNGTLYNKLAQTLSDDIYRIIKRKYCGNNNKLPILHKLKKKKDLKTKLTKQNVEKYEQSANK